MADMDGKESKNDDIIDGNNMDSDHKLSEDEIKSFREQIFKIRHPNGSRKIPWPKNTKFKETKLGGLAIMKEYEWTDNNVYNRAFEVEIKKFIGFKYILDLNGTENHDIQTGFDKNGMIITAELQPFEQEIIALISRDNTKKYQLKINGKWETSEIQDIIVKNAIAMSRNKIKAAYDKCLDAGISENISWEKQTEVVRDNEIRFVDGEFYPDYESLYLDGKKSKFVTKDKIMWRRVNDYYKGNNKYPQIFKDNNSMDNSIKPEFVIQGDADDAWLVSVLSSMAMKPKLIENLFITKDESNDNDYINNDKYYGYFKLKFCQNGTWIKIVIDDYIPCNQYWLPVYTSTINNDQIWCELIEKSYAKLFGCYQKLDNGDPSHAFADLTGYPVKKFKITENDDENVFDELQYGFNNNSILAVGVCDEDSNLGSSDISLIGDHCYTILNVLESSEGKVLLLRDPFGRTNYNGNLGPSNIWTKKLKQELKYNSFEFEPNINGLFWIFLDEFLKYFTSVSICFCPTNLLDSRIGVDLSFDHENNSLAVPVVTMTINNNSSVQYIGLMQQDKRCGNNIPDPLDICLFILSNNDNDISSAKPVGFIPMTNHRQNFIKFGKSNNTINNDDDSKNDNNNNIECILDAGQYILIPYTSGLTWDKSSGASRSISISVYTNGNNNTSLKITDGLTSDKMDNIFLNFACILGDKKMWNDLERRHLQIGRLDIYAGINTSNDDELIYSMQGNELSNTINCYGYPDLTTKQSFNLLPKQSKVFAVQTCKDPNKESFFAYKTGLKTAD